MAKPKRSPVGTSNAFNSKPSIADPLSDKEFDNLKAEAATHGITLKDSLRGLPGMSVVAAYEGVRRVKQEFPQAPDDLFTVSAEYEDSGAEAWAHPIEGITVNTKYYSDYQKLSALTESEKASGWSPASGAQSITAHEAGHLIESALIRKELGLGPGDWTYRAAVMWNKGTQSGKIIRSAVSKVNKTPGTKKKKIEHLRDLSRYAGSRKTPASQNAEGLAEAVSDYVNNQGTSKPISGFVWDILKQELG